MKYMIILVVLSNMSIQHLTPFQQYNVPHFTPFQQHNQQYNVTHNVPHLTPFQQHNQQYNVQHNVQHLTPFQQHNVHILHHNVLSGRGVPKQVADAFYSVPNRIISNSFKKSYPNPWMQPNRIVSWSTRDYWEGDYRP